MALCFVGFALVLVGVLASMSNGELAWTYNDLVSWGQLGMCSHSDDQSPTNIPRNDLMGAYLAPLKRIFTPLAPVKAELVTNTFTWEVRWPTTLTDVSEARVSWYGKLFDLTSWRYHSPSEHSFAGKYFDMEVQHFHKSEDGTVLVVSVPVMIGNENNVFLDQFWTKFLNNSDTVASASITHDRLEPHPWCEHSDGPAFGGSMGRLSPKVRRNAEAAELRAAEPGVGTELAVCIGASCGKRIHEELHAKLEAGQIGSELSPTAEAGLPVARWQLEVGLSIDAAASVGVLR